MRRLLFLLCFVLGLAMYASPAFASTELASYYDLTGNLTASGDVLEYDDLTAASPYLPFGTELTVCYQTCVSNVVVTDRGPYYGGRTIDLNVGVANLIGLTYVGVDYVDVYVESYGSNAYGVQY